jgi:hypothetical protein
MDQKFLTEHLAPLIGDFVKRAIAPLGERIKVLEQRPVTKYCGVFEIGRQYQEGNFVTDHGSIWHCNATTRQRPGGNSDWTLAVKSGQQR